MWTEGLRDTDRKVLRALARWFTWRADGTNVRPDIKGLVQKSGVPLRSVERALQRLSRDGWLEVKARGNRERTTYRICVERLADEDPEQVQIVVSHDPQFDRHSGGRVADETGFDRQSGGRVADEAHENTPDFEKVADERSRTRDLYVQRSGTTTGYTHTHRGADAPTDQAADEAPRSGETFRHPSHAYCGAWFCVPDFLDGQFRQQSGWSREYLQAWYRAENARAIREKRRIGNALKFLRGRFADLVSADTCEAAPEQLTFGPMVPAVETPPAAQSDGANVWTEIIARIHDKVNRHSFETWFQRTRLLSRDGASVTISVPNDETKAWLLSHYAVILQEALAEIGRPDLTVTFVTLATDRRKTG